MSKDKNSDTGTKSSGSFLGGFNPGYVVAGVASLVTSYLSIGSYYFQNLFEDKVYAKLRQTREERKKALYEHPENFATPELRRAESKTLQNEYHTAINTNVKAAGFESTWSKFRDLRVHQKLKVGLTVATVTAIALGAAYSIRKDKRLADRLQQQQQELDSKQSERSA